MRIYAILFLASILATQVASQPAIAEEPTNAPSQGLEVTHDVEMKLAGSCARFFGRTRINPNGARYPLPISPIFSDFEYDYPNGRLCVVTLRYTNKKNREPMAGVTVQLDRIESVTPTHWNTKTLKKIKTDRNGEARFAFPWDYTACGVEFRTESKKIEAQHDIRLFTERGYTQICQCKQMFYPLDSAEDIVCE
jgi:hypothetical protein